MLFKRWQAWPRRGDAQGWPMCCVEGLTSPHTTIHRVNFRITDPELRAFLQQCRDSKATQADDVLLRKRGVSKAWSLHAPTTTAFDYPINATTPQFR